VSATLTASRLRELEATESAIARPLTTVRRVVVASIAPFPTAALTRLVARMAARHRSGRILLATPEWALYPEPTEARAAQAAPGTEGLVRTHGSVWVGSPELDDRYFDVSFTDAGPVSVDAIAPMARARDAVCLVVPVERAAAEAAVGLAEQLTHEGRRVVVAFDRTRPGRIAWARAVSPRLAAPAVSVLPDPALLQPARLLSARTLLTAAELTGHLMTDPIPTPTAEVTA
jgi:hypothetical protein